MNSLVVFRHNCLPLLGCGFKCVFRYSQRLLFYQDLYVFALLLYRLYYIGFALLLLVNPEHRKHFVTQCIATLKL